jgi:uncharacterized membrane protein
MNHTKPSKLKSVLARASIWTIVNHNFLAGQIRIYIWFASATILFLSVASIIPLHTALYLLLFCGSAMIILLWSLINWRKAILLDIQNSELKKTAHAAMLALIHSKASRRDKMKKKPIPIFRRFSRKSHL